MGTKEADTAAPENNNPIGLAGAIISGLGCACCVASLIVVSLLGSSTTKDQSTRNTSTYGSEYRVAHEAIEKTGKVVEEGLTFLAQVILFVVGGLIGGTLSAVGLVLSAIGILRQPNRVAKIGLAAGFIGPGLLSIKMLVAVY